MRRMLMAVALSVSLTGIAMAGGLHANVEGPAKDGVTYTVRAYSCAPGMKLEPWALAEGLVDGKPQSVLLRLKPTAKADVYTFQRAWPERGDWLLRVNLGQPPAPATVVTLGPDGAVRSNELFHGTDGSPECRRALAKIAKQKGITLDDDC